MALDLSIGDRKEIFAGTDSLVFKKILEVKTGGVVVDTTGYTESTIKAGHIIINDDGTYKLMPTSSGAFGTLPVGAEYVGFCAGTVSTSYPAIGIVVRGTVNPKVLPYTLSAALQTAISAALPLIRFEED